MAHVAIQEADEEGNVTWLDHVTDERVPRPLAAVSDR